MSDRRILLHHCAWMLLLGLVSTAFADGPADNVADNALAFERSTQVSKPGWAERFRAAKLARKAAK